MDAVAVKTNKFGGVRSSNIELFRILSMLMIVAHHYVVNSGLMNCIDAQVRCVFKIIFSCYLAGAAKPESIVLY